VPSTLFSLSGSEMPLLDGSWRIKGSGATGTMKISGSEAASL
jgi:hypothetical protein